MNEPVIQLCTECDNKLGIEAHEFLASLDGKSISQTDCFSSVLSKTISLMITLIHDVVLANIKLLLIQ